MSSMLESLSWLINVVFAAAALLLSVFGLVDALRHRPEAFTAAGKASKTIWLVVLGIAVALGFTSMVPYPAAFSLQWILAMVGSGVYVADVRPALPKTKGRGPSGGGSANRW